VETDPRTGVIRITATGASGSPMDVTVTQQAHVSCSYSISPTNSSFSADGESKSISVTPSSSNCTWTTSESLSWASISPTSGTGSGSVTVSVDPNTGDARSGSVTIAGETYEISQGENDPKRLNIAYTARNGLTVTLTSFEEVDTGGYYNYTVSYTQKNNTTDAIDEGQLKLYLANNTGLPQYGFFNKLYPGDTTFLVFNIGSGSMNWTAEVTSGNDWLSITSGSSGFDSGTITCQYDANTEPDNRIAIIQVTAENATGSPVDVIVEQRGVFFLPPTDLCGAFVAPGVWKEFDCYNLAAIGKTTDDNPFTPSWSLIGGYWQWGWKGPSSDQWYTTNTPNFAHGPTGPGDSEANDGEINGWNQIFAPNGAWSDEFKTTNDPCHSGFRVPTKNQWYGVIENNRQSIVGTWSSNATNYSSARFFGNDLMLPATGLRNENGSLWGRGNFGRYWSSTAWLDTNAGYLHLYDSDAGTMSNYDRGSGLSIRCIAE
jgi:uncharacterized protein (TIGR02145 family)